MKWEKETGQVPTEFVYASSFQMNRLLVLLYRDGNRNQTTLMTMLNR